MNARVLRLSCFGMLAVCAWVWLAGCAGPAVSGGDQLTVTETTAAAMTDQDLCVRYGVAAQGISVSGTDSVGLIYQSNLAICKAEINKRKLFSDSDWKHIEDGTIIGLNLDAMYACLGKPEQESKAPAPGGGQIQHVFKRTEGYLYVFSKGAIVTSLQQAQVNK